MAQWSCRVEDLNKEDLGSNPQLVRLLNGFALGDRKGKINNALEIANWFASNSTVSIGDLNRERGILTQ